MKSIIALSALVVACVAAVALADFTDVASAQYDGKTNIRKSHTAIDANFEMVKAQADTNATTTATGYTPDFAGQVLVGSQGGGTNAIWIAKGTTTNDWVIVQP